MNWFRCYSEFATDPKVQIMPEHMQRRLIMLFCLRCSNELATLHETEICFALRITEQELLETKGLFIQKEFINERWEILNWDKRQYVSDTSTERSRKHRANKKKNKQQTCNVAATPPEQNRTEQNRVEESENKQCELLKKLSRTDMEIWLTQMEMQGKPITIDVETELEKMRAHFLAYNGYDKNGNRIFDWVNKAKSWLLQAQIDHTTARIQKKKPPPAPERTDLIDFRQTDTYKEMQNG